MLELQSVLSADASQGTSGNICGKVSKERLPKPTPYSWLMGWLIKEKGSIDNGEVKLGMVVNYCNPRTQETEERELEF